MSSWFDDVAKHILNHFDDYINHFFSNNNIMREGKTIRVGPCYNCGSSDALSFTPGFNGTHCLSCGTSCSLIDAVKNFHGDEEGLDMLAKWSGIAYPFATYNSRNAADKEKAKRAQKLYHEAIHFYHRNIIGGVQVTDSHGEMKVPGLYQIEKRQHTRESLVKNKVGYSTGHKALKSYLLEQGYQDEEIQEAFKLVGAPDGFFVYPYYDEKGNFLRIGCKAFIVRCRGKQKKGGGFEGCDHKYITFNTKKPKNDTHFIVESDHVPSNPAFSTGNKTFFFTPSDLKSKKKFLILVEGEDDKISVEEALAELPEIYQKKFMVAAMGGNMGKGAFESSFLRRFEEIYECFDNDETGDKYREQLDEEMPDVIVRHMKIPRPEEYNDIDLFLKAGENAIESFKQIIDEAKMVTTNHSRIWRDFPKHQWFLKTREFQLKYEIEKYDTRKKGFAGHLEFSKQGRPQWQRPGDLAYISVEQNVKSHQYALSDHLRNYYHVVPWLEGDERKPIRPLHELLDVYWYSNKQEEIQKQIAWYLHHANSKEYSDMARKVEKVIRNHDHFDLILKVVNTYQNHDFDEDANYPQIQISQAFFPRNNDGYMYFAKFLKDGDIPKVVPCLISNRKIEIRLDLFKQADPQSLLLVDNKYNLPREIPVNVRKDTENLSLQYKWVKKWVNNEIKEDSLKPEIIIQEIESLIRQMYYTANDTIKVLALWIYTTYFYTLFGDGFPYLLINGAKGTGKSTVDNIIQLTAFNPTFVVSTSAPAMYRSLNVFGGTYILDEVENLTDTKKANENDLATILRAGYSMKGVVQRIDKDTNLAEDFQVFSPKVISNISGVEAVIGDRCILIETFKAPEDKVKQLVPPRHFMNEGREKVHSITSRAALSALTHFQDADEILNADTRWDTGNLRLTQILQPLVTIAKLVGGDYLDCLERFYQHDIKRQKDEIALNTLEGKINHIFMSLAEEILDLTDKKWVLAPREHDKPIVVNRDLETFSIDSLHLKLLSEELASNGEVYGFSEINMAMRNVLGKDSTSKSIRQSTRVTITDEGLLKRMNNQKYPRVYRWTLNLRRFLSKQTEMYQYDKQEKQEEQEAELF